MNKKILVIISAVIVAAGFYAYKLVGPAGMDGMNHQAMSADSDSPSTKA